MPDFRRLLGLCVVVACGCGDDDAAGDAARDAAVLDEAGSIDEPQTPEQMPEAGAPDGAVPGTGAQALAWASELIAAYDRTVAANCPCLVSAAAFASAADCMAALGSGPTWLSCASDALGASDAGFTIDETHARCLIDAAESRAQCLEQAACEAEATSACLSMPDRPADCPQLDNALVVYLLEQCPDLGLLSR